MMLVMTWQGVWMPTSLNEGRGKERLGLGGDLGMQQWCWVWGGAENSHWAVNDMASSVSLLWARQRHSEGGGWLDDVA
jgi:hypothetical protein